MGAPREERLAVATRDMAPERQVTQLIPGYVPPVIRAIAALIFVFIGVQIGFSLSHAPVGLLVAVELLYILGIVTASLARFAPTTRAILGYSIACLVICLTLHRVIQGDSVNVPLIVLVFSTLTRLPTKFAIAVIIMITLAFCWVNGLDAMVLGWNWRFPVKNSGPLLGYSLTVYLPFVLFALSFRSRSQAIAELRAAQAQLRAEMRHTSELAATRERARIARDIHDVLAHSLTVLSVQLQAARQLVRQEPERAAGLLDEMGAMLKESLAESRNVVGLLREAPTEATGDEGAYPDLRARLLATAERFTERTGLKCDLDEQGAPRELAAEQTEALSFALQEALTNAYRHGAAQHLRARLAWQVHDVTLSMVDDGRAQPAPAEALGSGQGLRGMRERAEALGGAVTAGSQPDGGFSVVMRLPLDVTPEDAQGVA